MLYLPVGLRNVFLYTYTVLYYEISKVLPYKNQASKLKFCYCPYRVVFPLTFMFLFFQDKYVLYLSCLQQVGGNIFYI